jgi:hypothetical protein
MFNKTAFALSTLVLFGSASASFALDTNAKPHRATTQLHHVMASESYAAQAASRPITRSSRFDSIWFRLAEGPEWN